LQAVDLTSGGDAGKKRRAVNELNGRGAAVEGAAESGTALDGGVAGRDDGELGARGARGGGEGAQGQQAERGSGGGQSGTRKTKREKRGPFGAVREGVWRTARAR